MAVCNPPDAYMAVTQALHISNNIYGTHELSAYELANAFSRPLTGPPAALSSTLFHSHMKYQAKHKLTKILPSKLTTFPEVSFGDLFEVFIKKKTDERSSWTTMRVFYSIYRAAWRITVPYTSSHTICEALEDVRPAINDDSFAISVLEANCVLDGAMHDMFDHVNKYHEST